MSIASGVIFQLIIVILSQLLKRNIILKLFGIIILIGIIGICWYASLVVAGTKGYDNSNIWAF